MRSYEEVIDGAVPLVRGSDLAKCANFAVLAGSVLAGSTVTNTGATRVTGDFGVSPGTAVTDWLSRQSRWPPAQRWTAERWHGMARLH